MDSKPIITFAGEKQLFESLHQDIVQDLPTESVEWRRSFGRAPKSVCIEPVFIPFAEKTLKENNDKTLIDQAFFHTFWIECPDMDTYRAITKDEIVKWTNVLRLKNIPDWLIVLVEGGETKKGSKTKLLPRTSVLDKIKNDFCSKQRNRCICLQKGEVHGGESWEGVLHRIRHLLLSAYSRNLNRFEENMRCQRERRNDVGWSYCEYFLLQEELAFVYEMLCMYDEALVQYDELDALFAQFVINSSSGETPKWLTAFSKPCSCWEGPSLCRKTIEEKRRLIQDGTASLLDLRNYLFSRQCELLLLLFRPWEVAQRLLPFMHSCINELEILEVEMPEGAIACWVFLSCLEILHTCEKFNDSTHVEAYSLYTASLWAYARSKLQILGNLCGLMPDMEATSEQLHHVVELVAGMGLEQNIDDVNSPLSKLKEALSSKQAFQKRYLEMSELAVGTFKHIGRIRSARLIGCDLAEFYMKLGEPHKSVVFLMDALKTFEEERWPLLIGQTQIQIANCYNVMGDVHKFIKMALLIASNLALDKIEQVLYFNQAQSKMNELPNDEQLSIFTGNVFQINNVELVANDQPLITIGSKILLKLIVHSNLPKVIHCDKVVAAVGECSDDPFNVQTIQDHGDKFQQTAVRGSGLNVNSRQPKLDLIETFEYQEDKTLQSAVIACRNTYEMLRHQDSHNTLNMEKDVTVNFSTCFLGTDFSIDPGINEITLSCEAENHGQFSINQVIFHCGQLQLVLPKIIPSLRYEVVHEPPSVSISRFTKGHLFAGIYQKMALTVHSGSATIEADTCLKLEASSGLLIQQELQSDDLPVQLTTSITCKLLRMLPFQTITIGLVVLSDLKPQRDASVIHHTISVDCPWSPAPEEIELNFLPPFMSLHQLFTANNRKFVQVVIHGLNVEQFELKNHNLVISNNKDVVMVPLNIPNQSLLISQDQSAWYLWELVSNLLECPVLELIFTVQYNWKSKDNLMESSFNTYSYDFVISDYKTLFVIQSKVEPKGSEFCRTGSMCNMHIHILKTNPSNCSSLMYEVVADQTSWAVCGRTAGVVNMEIATRHSVVLDVMPLTIGFLPLPTVRLSKYIPADASKETPKRGDTNVSVPGFSRLEQFSVGQVYNCSEALQMHVIPAPNILTDSL